MLIQEVVNMRQPRRACSREVKQVAVNLVTADGHQTAQVAQDLGVTPNLLRRWKQEVAGDPVAAFLGTGQRNPHEEELAGLKRGGPCDAGAGFLKSVVAYFAKPLS